MALVYLCCHLWYGTACAPCGTDSLWQVVVALLPLSFSIHKVGSLNDHPQGWGSRETNPQGCEKGGLKETAPFSVFQVSLGDQWQEVTLTRGAYAERTPGVRGACAERTQ